MGSSLGLSAHVFLHFEIRQINYMHYEFLYNHHDDIAAVNQIYCLQVTS